MNERIREVKLRLIILDAGTQSRSDKRLNEDAIIEYAAAYKAKADMPPINCVEGSGGELWPWDGFHRIEAAIRAGLKTIPARLIPGTAEDAVWLSLGANKGHGLRRSNADKRAAVEKALSLKPDASDRAIAEHCGVSQPFVSAIRKESGNNLTGESGDNGYHLGGEPSTRTGRDGKSYPVSSQQVDADDDCPFGDSDAEPSFDDAPAQGEEAASEQGEAHDADETYDEGEESPGIETPRKTSVSVKPPPAVDDWGIPIQPHAIEAFDAVPKFKELLSLLRQAQKRFGELALSYGGKFLALPGVSSFRRGKIDEETGEASDRFIHEGIETAMRQVRAAMPRQTVCPYEYADAPHPADCRTCLGLRWTPELTSSIPPVCIERAKEAHGV